jgi:hypothetical protein
VPFKIFVLNPRYDLRLSSLRVLSCLGYDIRRKRLALSIVLNRVGVLFEDGDGVQSPKRIF